MTTKVDPPYEHHEHYPKDMRMPIYNNENPHPEFGKNPNIRNAQGHTEYPKLVFPKDAKPAGKKATKLELEARVAVNNPQEEANVTGEEVTFNEETYSPKEKEEVEQPKKPKGWNKAN